MTITGVDYSQGYDIKSLKGGGVQFACRYIGYTDTSLPQDKILTYSEVFDLLKNGISIVSNWEWTADRASKNNDFYNGSSSLAFSGGVSDAAKAVNLHRIVGGPDSAPIYFSIDFSTNGVDCVDYFRGINSLLPTKRIGAYGPPEALMYLLKQGLITYTWFWSEPNPSDAFTPNIIQVRDNVNMNGMIVDADIAPVSDFGQWSYPSGGLPLPQWFQYPTCVPFGNENFDVNLGGSHDLCIAALPNMPVTSLVSGVISDISSPDWGKQVCVGLDIPVRKHPYFAHLHLSATNPSLRVGSRIKEGDLIGWVGGANQLSQYNGTTNPTGKNFLNSPSMSSQVQLGIALHDGPAYGGPGWTQFPPIDTTLDPYDILFDTLLLNSPMQVDYRMQQFKTIWTSSPYGLKWFDSGLYHVRLASFTSGRLGACTPTGDEIETVDHFGNTIKWQRYDDGSHGEWYPSGSGNGKIYDAMGRQS